MEMNERENKNNGENQQNFQKLVLSKTGKLLARLSIRK